jgi:hypothetical protein
MNSVKFSVYFGRSEQYPALTANLLLLLLRYPNKREIIMEDLLICAPPEALYNELRGKVLADVHNDAFKVRYVGDGAVLVKPSWQAPTPPRGKAFISVEHGGHVTRFGTIDYSSSQEAGWYELATGKERTVYCIIRVDQ